MTAVATRTQANNKQLLTQFIIRLVGGLEENVTCVGGEKDSTTSRTVVDMSVSEGLGSRGEGLCKASPTSARNVTKELGEIVRVCDLMGLNEEEGLGIYILQLNKKKLRNLELEYFY